MGFSLYIRVGVLGVVFRIYRGWFLVVICLRFFVGVLFLEIFSVFV